MTVHLSKFNSPSNLKSYKLQATSYKLQANFGVGMVELLIAMGVGVLVAMTVTVVSIEGFKNMRTIGRWRHLQSDAVYITDAFQYWVKQAELLSLGGTTLDIRIDSNTTKTFTFSGTDIMLDPDGTGPLVPVRLNASNIEISGGSFILLPRSAKISFTLDSTLGDETMTITTASAQRNYP